MNPKTNKTVTTPKKHDPEKGHKCNLPSHHSMSNCHTPYLSTTMTKPFHHYLMELFPCCFLARRANIGFLASSTILIFLTWSVSTRMVAKANAISSCTSCHISVSSCKTRAENKGVIGTATVPWTHSPVTLDKQVNPRKDLQLSMDVSAFQLFSFGHLGQSSRVIVSGPWLKSKDINNKQMTETLQHTDTPDTFHDSW